MYSLVCSWFGIVVRNFPGIALMLHNLAEEPMVLGRGSAHELGFIETVKNINDSGN